MAQRGEIYQCGKQGLLVEVLTPADCTLQCCGEEMAALTANTQDAAVEKHVPAIERNGSTIRVQVGSVAHPMDPDHWIEFIEVLDGDCLQRKYLHPGDAPVAEFTVCGSAVTVREHCNKHGLWKAEG
ncbi:MAG TPA: desulfoferrodoxin [Armatimonadota bacterium]|nr:desulfoferrodoxin [Armatimonadota bacterium]HQK93135.1 desulfoferrodoxin [Armatimonadota bacterium]